MASLVLGIAGAVALGPAGLAWGGALGMTGAQIGFMGGSMLGSMLFAPNMPDIQGARLGDLKVQGSTYGTMIPIYYGTSRGAGQVIWSSDLIETAHEEEAGGKGGNEQTVTTYTYSVNCAVLVCEGEITGIRRIWANSTLIYDASEGNMGATGQSDNIRIYTGSETQMPDALIEAYEGAGNVPAHRGTAYVVFENFQLQKYGNRTPSFTFEVVNSGSFTQPDYVQISNQSPDFIMNHPYYDGVVLSISTDNGGSNPKSLHIVDVISKTDRVIELADVPAQYCSDCMTHVYIILPDGTVMIDEIWICYDTFNSGYSNVLAVAVNTNTLTVSRVIRTDYPSIGFIGSMHFDKASGKVFFATSSSTINAGYNYVDPFTLELGSLTGIKDYGGWWWRRGATGETSIALPEYFGNVSIFVGCRFYKDIPSTTSYVTYDTRRKRYAWQSGYVGGKIQFTVCNEDDEFSTETFVSTTIGTLEFQSIDYFENADKYFLLDRLTIYILNADTFQTERTISVVEYPFLIRWALELKNLPEYIVTRLYDASQDSVALVPITDRLSSNSVQLSSIVTDICERSGLGAGDINVLQLTDEVLGYTIAQRMSGRAAIDGLQAAFFFDAVESD